MIRYYDRLKKIEEMFPLLHAAYKESISIDDSNKFHSHRAVLA
jgi:hypothetical protein